MAENSKVKNKRWIRGSRGGRESVKETRIVSCDGGEEAEKVYGENRNKVNMESNGGVEV